MSHHLHCCAVGVCCQRAEQETELTAQLRAGLGWDKRKEKYATEMVKYLLDNFDVAPKGTIAALDAVLGPIYAEKYSPGP